MRVGGVIFQVEGVAGTTVPAVSRTETVKLYVPTVVGVPLRTPVPDPIAIPGGSPPAERKNVYDGTPPEAVNGADVTGTLTGEGGRTGAVIVSPGGVIFQVEGVAGATVPAVSRTEIVKLYVPTTVGVPLRTPVPDPIAIPGGSPPAERKNV
jgi:hypothetical protein